jgi:hypothetical protein
VGLLRPRVAPPPVLRPLEFALPESTASRLRVTLGSGISIRAQREVDRVALAHEHFADIGNIAGGTDGERAAIAIFAMRCARNVCLWKQAQRAAFWLPGRIAIRGPARRGRFGEALERRSQSAGFVRRLP